MSEENDTNGIANLRKQFEEIQKQNQALADELGTYKTRDRQTSVGEVLKAKGANPAAAKFYTGDDTSEDAVTKWLEENAEVFGTPKQQVDPNVKASRRVADASFGNVGSLQNGPQNAGPILGNPEEILHAIKNLPYEELVKQGYMPAPDNNQLFNSRH